MAPVIFTFDLLGGADYFLPDQIDVDFLLSNGLLISLNVQKESTLLNLKKKLWDHLKDNDFTSLFDLKYMSNYVLASITQDSQEVEFYDNSIRLCDLKLFHWYFKLVELQENHEEKELNANISQLIGFNVDELKLIKDPEVLEYRLELFECVSDRLREENIEIKANKGLNLLLFKSIYAQSVNVDPNDFHLSKNSPKTRQNNSKFIEIRIIDDTNVLFLNYKNKRHGINERDFLEREFNLNVSLDITPVTLVGEYFKKKYGTESAEKMHQFQKTFFLNVCGTEEVLYGNEYKLYSYKSLLNKLPNENQQLTIYIEKSIEEQKRELEFDLKNSFNGSKIKLSWECNGNFSFYLDSLVFLPPINDCEKIFLKMAIFHGQELATTIVESSRFEWEPKDTKLFFMLEQYVYFNLHIKNIHRCARMCISLNYVTKKRKEVFTLGLISLNLFDYRGYLINGKKNLYFWPASSKSVDLPFISLFGPDVLGSNTDKNFVRLKCDFQASKLGEKCIYPNKKQIRSFIDRCSINSQDECFDLPYALENDNSLLEVIISKDPLAELTEQDKIVLWKRRQDCLESYPHSLPKLLEAVEWHNQSNVIEIYNLLNRWPTVKPLVALELLNGFYADIQVRKFAVKCLDQAASNEDLQMFGLQLIQALKNEPYFNNELAKFLLKQAFKSQIFGFDFFWNLKSELKNPKYKYYFGLIIEAYCRGIGSSVKILLKQNETLMRLTNMSQRIKSESENTNLVKTSFLQDTLKIHDNAQCLSDFVNPLNKYEFIGKIVPDHCKILSSAKKPLFLEWINNKEFAKYYENSYQLIFKHGDDLRQDMLTLQILKLFNIIWKNEGLDLKLLIYSAFSMGYKVGFIEVIKESKTVFNVQTDGGKRGKYQIHSGELYKWLCANNANEKLDMAVDNFTKSCAGFCVATFILGIGDRHPDNIMVNKEGKLFHIDFGHFLGNFKKKLGIKRERVPFVLTDDFTKVISKGASNPIDTPAFLKFRTLCEEAYMTIRKYSYLIINLFLLMIPANMPELQSTDDILYLRKKLAIDETNENALRFFQKEFNESHTFSITTKVDWVFHAINHA